MRNGRKPLVFGIGELAGLARYIELRAVSRWVGMGLAVGLAAGALACVLYLAIDAVRFSTLRSLAGLHPLEPAGEPTLFETRHGDGASLWWVAVLCPAVGAFASVWVVRRFAPEAAGGNEGWLRAFHHGRGRIRRRVMGTKLVASALHLGTGASAGREGPIGHMGAAAGAAVGRALHLSDRERRLLLVAGAAGGIGAIFRTPLGGALFVVEALYTDDLEVDALVPAVLSSVVAYSLFTTVFGQGQLFETAQTYQLDARELPLFVLMAICAGVVGFLFVGLHYRLSQWAQNLPVWPPLVALGAGLGVGLLSLVHPSALGAGYGWMQEALSPTGLIPLGWAGVGTLLLIAGVKVVATSLSSCSFAAGGVFGPSVVIGGMVGGAFGLAFHQIVPNIVQEPSSYMIVGMACFVGGVTSAPISTLVMASEMTGSYELLVPTMLAEVVTFTLIRKARLYTDQVPTRRDSPAHGGEYVLDILKDLKVERVFTRTEVSTVERSMPLPKLLRMSTETSQVVFPVEGEEGTPGGLVALETVRAFLYDEAMGMLAIAADCETPFVCLSTDDSLAVALERMATTHYQQLPVVDEAKPSRLVGLITYDDLLQAYSRELSYRKRGGVQLAEELGQ